MTASYQKPQTVPVQVLGPVLRAAHQVWIKETDSFLTPLLVPEASFWERLTAVRYLADQFLGQYRRERALVDELRPFLPADVAESLVRQGERIAKLQGQIDQVGRRRGTARTSSLIARNLLDAVRSWCADVEAGASEIRREALPAETLRLLTDLEVYAQTDA